MIHRARHDYIELSYAYGSALTALILFILLSAPIDTSKFGLILPSETEKTDTVYLSEAFQNIEVKAKAYVVYDIVGKRVVASKNEQQILPLASISKVMTAVTALNHHERDTVITINPSSIDEGYDLGLKKGQQWTLDELLKYTLVFSSNDGAYAIADTLEGRRAFVEQMNTESTLLGLGLTFTDPSGLDAGGNLGGVGTALDVAKLFAVGRRLYPDVFESTTATRITVLAGGERLTGVPNTNQEIETLFGAEASKTGFTDEAGGNLGVVLDVSLGRPVVIVVLGSTREERFSDVAKLYETLLKSLEKVEI